MRNLTSNKYKLIDKKKSSEYNINLPLSFKLFIAIIKKGKDIATNLEPYI